GGRDASEAPAEERSSGRRNSPPDPMHAGASDAPSSITPVVTAVVVTVIPGVRAVVPRSDQPARQVATRRHDQRRTLATCPRRANSRRNGLDGARRGGEPRNGNRSTRVPPGRMYFVMVRWLPWTLEGCRRAFG